MKLTFNIGLVLLLAFVMAFSVQAQAPADAPVSLVLMGSGFIEDNFDGRTWGAGIETGLQVGIDEAKGISLRATYKRANFGPAEQNAIGSFTTSGIVDWTMGDSWDFFLNLGGEHFVDGNLNGTDLFIGAGIGFDLLTSQNPEYKIPPQLRGFLEVSFADANAQPTQNYFQINLGILVPKPVKRELTVGDLERRDLDASSYTAVPMRFVHPEAYNTNRDLYLRYVLDPSAVSFNP